MPTNPDHKRPHVDSDTCGRCRKKLEQGHRVAVAHIVDRSGVDPSDLGRRGLFLFDEFEFAHINCKDPYLTKGTD